jgi:ComF family protein
MLLKTATAFRDLFFPHYCLGCAADFISTKEVICARCKIALPTTHFMDSDNNTIEKIFWGRLPIINAGALYYFNKHGLIQQLLIALKYKNNIEAGIFLGKELGKSLLTAERFSSIDAIIPLPLHPKKEYKRGYNQAQIIAQGIQEKWPKPILQNTVIRLVDSKTQTHENRANRWENMKNIFHVPNPDALIGKHILLIDDVITTGATLEACGQAILSVPNTKLSIAAVGYTL